MTQPIRVLVVDDDAAVRTSLAAYLEDEGINVRTATSGREAMRALAAEAFDMLIVDMRLPDTDGESLILRAHEVQPGLAFLIYTGSTLYRVHKSLREIGVAAEDVFCKPVASLGVLLTAAQRLHARKAAGHEA